MPTSCNGFSLLLIFLFSCKEKKLIASSTVIVKMLSIVIPWYLTFKISFLNLFPLQFSQIKLTSAMNCISIFTLPSPLQFSHLPPSTLKEKCFAL